MATSANTQEVVSISLSKAAKDANVTIISELRANTSGYAYITFITKDGASNNVYFGKNSAEALPPIGTPFKGLLHLLKDATIVQVMNADGETRFKVSVPKAGSKAAGYSTASEMAALFGIEEESAFDMAAFKAEFQTKQVAVTAGKSKAVV